MAVTLVATGGGLAGARTSSKALAEATINGSGSTFEQAFIDQARQGFSEKQPDVTVNYNGVGSGQGKADFASGITDFGGTDSPYGDSDTTKPTDPFDYIPTVVAPITVSYNLSGVDKLQLSPDTIAGIFSRTIKTWDDDAIKADNPKADLPGTDITVVHRAEGSGTTANFTKFLTKAAPTTWTLGTGSTVAWPSDTQGAQKNSGVGDLIKNTDGAIGYVDYSDARAIGLSFAKVENASGKFVAPSLPGASAAAAKAPVADDLTYDPLNAKGKKAYPITSPTWVVAYQTQSDKAKGAAVKAFLTYMLTDGQEFATEIDYAPLPKALQKQALAVVKKISA
jgi:phosphate transport system substrate-binding protein